VACRFARETASRRVTRPRVPHKLVPRLRVGTYLRPLRGPHFHRWCLV